jgi:hypothetical protein
MKNLYKSVLLALLLVGSTISFAQIPVYNSIASAPPTTPVIFLDFDGQYVAGTSWNYAGPITAAPSGLTTDQITEIYNRIAEDYRPFNINITTDSTKYSAAPINKRMRVLFTTTYSWYGSSAGGVAYTGSFTWGNNTPCWIFTSLLGYNAKYLAEAGAHEAGHTLGLRHQASYDASCNMTSAYNYGTGTTGTETSWAPIMGVGYYRNLTTWHNGPTSAGCNSIQQDLSVITSSTNGISFKTDDYSETFTAASSASFSNNEFTKTGEITTDTEKDMFKFTLSASRKFSLDAIPTNVGAQDAGSNLDLQVQLYDGSKNLVKTFNPTEALSVSVDTTLNAGTYYLLVDGVGNEYVSEYGSLGSYSLLAEEAPLLALPLHEFTLIGKLENGLQKLSWKIVADEKIISQFVEVSTNGRDFRPLAGVDALGRSYNYSPDNAGVLFYRLNITFDNNRQYYSNIIALRSNGIEGRPKLFTTLIKGNALMVSSPERYDYSINDYSGRIVAKGQITDGSSTINTNYLSSGTYMIRFVKGNDQYVEKFLKQ